VIGPVSPILLLLRLLLGGVFLFAAYQKLLDPQGAASTIEAFKFGAPDHLVMFGAYLVPWAELMVGAALVLGFWTRAAALLYTVAMASFIVAIFSVIQRDMDVNCQCLGRFKLFCGGIFDPVKDRPLGLCKVVENGVLLGGALLLLAAGGGRLSLDRIIYGRS
jgi:uncharacterized membrane protein YphA (DoxX/SURF4 family)